MKCKKTNVVSVFAFSLLAVLCLSAAGSTDIEIQRPSTELIIGALQVKRTGIAIPLSDTRIFCATGQRLPLFQENRLCYIAKTYTIEEGEQLSAFPKSGARGRGTAWVTAENLLIFATETPSFQGTFYLRKGEEIDVIRDTATAYLTLVKRHGWDTFLTIPHEIEGLEYEAFDEPLEYVRKMKSERDPGPHRAEPAKKEDKAEEKDEQPEQTVRKGRVRVYTMDDLASPGIIREPSVLEESLGKIPRPRVRETQTGKATETKHREPEQKAKSKSWFTKKTESWFSASRKTKEDSQSEGNAELADAEDTDKRENIVIIHSSKDKTKRKAPEATEPETAAQPEDKSSQKPKLSPADRDFIEAFKEPTREQDTQSVASARIRIQKTEGDSAALSSLGFLFEVILVVVVVLAFIIVRLQRQSSRNQASSGQIDTFFTMGESTGASYFENLAEEPGDFSGSLTGFSIIQLIHFLNSSQETGKLSLADEAHMTTGMFFFDKGELIDASYGQRRGVQAVYAVLKGDSASFTFTRTENVNADTTIEQPTMTLLLEASKQMDEEQAG